MDANRIKPDAYAFSLRLHQALDRISQCPTEGSGRGAWLTKKFKVSQPTTQGWLSGKYLPVPARVRKLADLAGVSYDWLYFGLGDMLGTGKGETFSPPSAGEPSQWVRKGTLSLALQLVAEALGESGTLSPQEHAESVLLVCDLLEEDWPQDQVLHIASRAIAARSESRGLQGGTSRKGRSAP